MHCPCKGGCASRLRSERSKSNEASPESRGFARRPWRNGDNCWNVAGAMPVRPGWPPELPPTMGRTPDGVSEPLLSGQHSPRFQVHLGPHLHFARWGCLRRCNPGSGDLQPAEKGRGSPDPRKALPPERAPQRKRRLSQRSPDILVRRKQLPKRTRCPSQRSPWKTPPDCLRLRHSRFQKGP
jgi:hypothetical protein